MVAWNTVVAVEVVGSGWMLDIEDIAHSICQFVGYWKWLIEWEESSLTHNFEGSQGKWINGGDLWGEIEGGTNLVMAEGG